MRHRVSLASAIAGVLVSGACSDPSYDRAQDSGLQADATAANQGDTRRDARASEGREDARVSDTGTGDAEVADAASTEVPGAGSVTNATLPAWAAPLIGQYGIRARFFNRNSTSEPGSIDWVMLGTFGFDAAKGQVTLTAEVCEASGTGTVLGVPTRSGPALPQKTPIRVWNVLQDGDGWATDSAPLRIGFAADPLVPCVTPGARVMAHNSQIWNKDGQCVCPTNSNTLPELSNDCRVNDVDDDGAPAATVLFTTASGNTGFHVLQYDASRIVRGTIDAQNRQHDARYAAVQESMQLTCPGPSGDVVCTKSPFKLCGSDDNPVRVSPLGPPGDTNVYKCADVLMRKGSLFGTDPATIPFPTSGC